MLSLLFYHLFITATCFNAGYSFYSFIYKKTPDVLTGKNFVVVLFTGLLFLTLLCQVLVLFFPVNVFTSFGLFLLFQALVFTKRKEYYGYLKKFATELKPLHPLIKTGFLTMWALLLLLNAGPTLMDDTESYHIQMVKWIQEYGTVPGIANLHERYGFNASWFSSVALFSLPVPYNYYTVLNGLVSVWLALYLWMQAAAAFRATENTETKKTGITSIFLLCVLLFLWPLLRGNVSTANYDFITSAMILVLFLETFSKPHTAVFNTYNIDCFLWPVYFFTVRIINFPLLLLSFFTLIALLKKGEGKRVGTFLFLAALLIVPFLIRNVLLSGYLFFPGPYINIFNVDWKVDTAVINDLLYYIKYYNRVNNMYQPLEKTAALPFPYWIGSWYQYLFYYDKPLLLSGIAGYVGTLVLWIQKRPHTKTAALFISALLLQMATWFLIAPDPRFIYGPLLCGTVLLLYAILPTLHAAVFSKLPVLLAGILILVATALFISKYGRDDRYRNPLLCRKLPQPSLQTIKMGTIELYIPDRVLNNWNARCYAAPLPCLYKVDSRLHLRGKTIKEGFSIQ